MELIISLVILSCILSGASLGLIIYFLQMEGPEIPTVEEMLARFKQSDGGVLSGRNRLNKKIDTIMGNMVLEQYPIAQKIADTSPELAKLIIDHPEALNYIQNKASSYVDKLGGNLPKELTTLIQSLLVGDPGPIPDV